MKYIQLFGRVIVGGVLIYAGFMKAAGPTAEFSAILEAYELFPPFLLTPLSSLLPYVEMWVGLFILSGFCTRQAALAAALLATSFAVSVGSTFLRHIDLTTCGCFGAHSLTPHQTMVLDIVLLGLSLVVYRLSKYLPPWSLDQALQ
jgi:uncharacterized membrane protein YphA (DoxX/SURF4 family)